MDIEQAKKGIKYAYITANLTVLVNLYFLTRIIKGFGFKSGLITILSTVLIFTLAQFLYFKKSRIAAVALLLFFVINKLMSLPLIVERPSRSSWVIVVLLCYISGVVGTFVYQKMNKKTLETPLE